jgi:hypothetical protein
MAMGDVTSLTAVRVRREHMALVAEAQRELDDLTHTFVALLGKEGAATVFEVRGALIRAGRYGPDDDGPGAAA